MALLAGREPTIVALLDEIVAGIIAVVALALLFDVLLYAAGRALTPWTRKELVGR